MYDELTTPAVIVDLDIVDANITKMASKLKSVHVAHRPHVKTHKSLSLAKRQLDAGAIGITVAKLSEAEVFVEAGIDDILIAYSLVGDDKLRRFAALHQRANLMTTVDSPFVAEGLSRVGIETGKPVRVLIEMDGGLHRGGRQPGEDSVQFAQLIRALRGIEIVGIMAYFGMIYDEHTREGLIEATRRESELIRETVEQLESNGVRVQIISAGSTPAASISEFLPNVTEIRAGNYIFYDATAVALGVATEEDCALRIVATVVSTPIPGMATIDAGTKTLTSDLAHHREGYGIVVGGPRVTITKLNEEHGFLEFDPHTVHFSVGDRIEVIPNHSCVIPNLNNTLAGVRKGKVVEQINIDARGSNY